jgi:Tol biopolymer transport system component
VQAATLTLACFLMAVVAACGAPSAAPTPVPSPAGSQPALPPATFPRPQVQGIEPTPNGGLNLKGRFVFAQGDGSLMVEDAGSNNPRVVFKASAELYGDTPVFSPDRKEIAFSAISFTKDGAVLQDIRVMNADGSNMRTVATPEQPKITYGFPAWSPDGKSLYITQSYSVPPASQHDEIDLVSAAGGALKKVFENAREASISPDGKMMVYSQLDLATYSSSLWAANISGSNPKQVLPTGVFAAIIGARFSPDSQSIVFAESGPANKKLPGAYAFESPSEESPCAVSLVFVCLVERAEAHGLPWDLWLVNLDGSKFTRLTNIGADSPVPAWSADGKQIAFFDATGIYVLDLATTKIHQVSDSRGYGGFDWK